MSCLFACTLSQSHFLIEFAKNGIEVTTPKSKKGSLGSTLHHPFCYFDPQKCLKIHANINDNFCLKWSRIARIPTSYRKSRLRNTIVTWDFRMEEEISQVCTCTLKNTQYNLKMLIYYFTRVNSSLVCLSRPTVVT